MRESKIQLKKETWKEQLRFHWMGFRVIVYIIEIPTPLLIDVLCGHIAGTVAAVLNIIGWLYFGLKARLAPGTRMLWLTAFIFVWIVAAVEFRVLSTGQIMTSYGIDIISGILFWIFALGAIGNCSRLLRGIFGHRRGSGLPIIFGALGTISLAIAPAGTDLSRWHSFWWMPLFIDVGCIPWLLYYILTLRKNR